jgi:hypothetical protein
MDESLYLTERKARIKRIKCFDKYIEYVNTHCELLPSIKQFDDCIKSGGDYNKYVPIKPEPMPPSMIFKLIEYAQLLKMAVIPKLPASKEYVASFSLTPEFGWVLWDIYGQWYNR